MHMSLYMYIHVYYNREPVTTVYLSHVHVSVFLLSSTIQKPGESTVHLLPFMLSVGEDDLKGLYQKVKNAMLRIHKLNHDNNIRALEKIASEWLV